MRAKASLSRSSNSRNRNITRARRNGGCADHEGNAAAAASTALFTSAAEANGTRFVTQPVAGSKTSPKRPDVPATSTPFTK